MYSERHEPIGFIQSRRKGYLYQIPVAENASSQAAEKQIKKYAQERSGIGRNPVYPLLRQGIQRHLKSNPSVKSFRNGVYGEGENGVTIVELK